MPDIGEGINEVEVKGWLVKAGDPVKEFDGLCEVESDKATVTISSRFEGLIAKLHYEVGDMAKVGKPLVDIEMISPLTNVIETTSESKQQQSDTQSSLSSKTIESKPAAVAASNVTPQTIITALPAARRLARERGIDLNLIRPTGRQGQILKEDVMVYLSELNRKEDHLSRTNSETNFDTTNESLERQVPLRGIKRAMFKTMTQSVEIPHFNYADEIDMTRLVGMQGKLLGETFQKVEQTKISNFAIIIKMVSLALNKFPQLNASVDESGEFMVEKNYHNVGVAVDTEAGLIVPNIKNVQTLTINQINLELQRLRKLGYESKLGPNDLSGGTITLSNIGAIGGIFGVPVLVRPEIVIGALGRIRKLPRYNSLGGIDERQIMQLVWSADHRIVDGATLSRFTNLLKCYLEEPESALLNMV